MSRGGVSWVNRAPPVYSGQLELDLFPGVPWAGKSPRALTRAQIHLSLRREPPGHAVCVDPMQLSLWHQPGRPLGKTAVARSAAAPSLVGSGIRRRRSRFRECLRNGRS